VGGAAEVSDRQLHTFTVDYRERDGGPRYGLLHRGYFAIGLPRLIPTCRLLGHKPVVDGVGSPGEPGLVSRWVCCDRCGIRPAPQGRLDPQQWNVGDPYPRSLGNPLPAGELSDPGAWSSTPTGEVGAEVIIGRNIGGCQLSVKVGNRGSEHTLAAHARLHPVFSLHLHTEGFGTWLQRRLNPTGYESKLIEVGANFGMLHWKLWSDRDHSGARSWRHGSVCIDPRDLLLGPRRRDWTDVGEPVTTTVRMPHGDDHQATLQLQRHTEGRTRIRKRRYSWWADWHSRPGITTRPGDRGAIMGAHVVVSDDAVRAGTWPEEAAVAIAAQLTADRTKYGYVSPDAEQEDLAGPDAARWRGGER
jgi:hypothetical protein